MKTKEQITSQIAELRELAQDQRAKAVEATQDANYGGSAIYLSVAVEFEKTISTLEWVLKA